MKKAKAKKYAWDIIYRWAEQAYEDGTIENKVDAINREDFKGQLTGASQQKIVDSFDNLIDEIWKKLEGLRY